MNCHVTFLPEGKTADVPEGTKISDAGIKAGVSIKLPCAGNGRCGKCIVEVGNERVLACQTEVSDGMVITVPKEDQGKVIAAIDHRAEDIGDLSPLSEGYGLAVDIGTTTVAAEIIDLSTGEVVFKTADMNLQRSRGEDVLARIEYAGEGGTEELRNLVIETINGLIDTCDMAGFSEDRITSAYIAGNTAMTHLFLGIDPSPIRYPPFEPVVKDATITVKESRLHINKDA